MVQKYDNEFSWNYIRTYYVLTNYTINKVAKSSKYKITL